MRSGSSRDPGRFTVRRRRGGRVLWLAVAALLPVAWAGVWVGHRAHLRLAPATAARIIAATLFIAGAALVARSL